ncbi:hypothetical protein [Candidatus Palauibacter sp.]|uniref:hypothetical protein n=1 Tax=Candidatus Palauibacter sp. TaxID=3101350 RepID=UPI003AF30481
MSARGSRAGRGVALGMAAALTAGAAVAQQTSAEVRGGWMVGNHTSTEAGLDWVPEFSYEIRVRRQVRPGITLAAGYIRTAFGCEEGFCRGSEPTVTGNHAAIGAELFRGALWARIGALYGAIRVGTQGEAPQAGLGVEAGAGIRIRVGRLRLGPGVSWRRMFANTPSSADHAVALGIDLGVGLDLD